MPIGEIEQHPYLKSGEIIGSTKLILGSFPVYECTDEDNDYKRGNRSSEGTIRFFYGSNRNSLWSKYKCYVDDSVNSPWDSDEIISRLKVKGIAVTDLIASCERYIYKKGKNGDRILYPYSSEDGALHVVQWNFQRVQNLILNGVRKILCTSKGVLSNLERQVIFKNNFGVTEKERSNTFQRDFVETLGGDIHNITKPIAKSFIVSNKLIEALAMPSPGSPQRQLKEFGFSGDSWQLYADAYFENAFK